MSVQHSSGEGDTGITKSDIPELGDRDIVEESEDAIRITVYWSFDVSILESIRSAGFEPSRVSAAGPDRVTIIIEK